MSSDTSPTRERILQAALSLLEAGGALRMSDIARKAGVSRQALYLHFASRAELLIETTRHLDRITGSEAKLAPSRAAKTGRERLDAFVTAWSHYLPRIDNSARTLIALAETDAEAREAWSKRMQDMREGCEAAIVALARDGDLAPDWPPERATDLLWTLLSYQNWRQMTGDCGMSDEAYRAEMLTMVRKLFVKTG
ncbi:MAG: TetR/AcrR family transcriptional regulator [Minwuia sp.]|uniref:TetR/AcrR family transcriptional regulator n=1 Tax=Minwuia sp. TaxID=2493630 RepID=UPI003A86C6ED